MGIELGGVFRQSGLPGRGSTTPTHHLSPVTTFLTSPFPVLICAESLHFISHILGGIHCLCWSLGVGERHGQSVIYCPKIFTAIQRAIWMIWPQARPGNCAVIVKSQLVCCMGSLYSFLSVQTILPVELLWRLHQDDLILLDSLVGWVHHRRVVSLPLASSPNKLLWVFDLLTVCWRWWIYGGWFHGLSQ